MKQKIIIRTLAKYPDSRYDADTDTLFFRDFESNEEHSMDAETYADMVRERIEQKKLMRSAAAQLKSDGFVIGKVIA